MLSCIPLVVLNVLSILSSAAPRVGASAVAKVSSNQLRAPDVNPRALPNYPCPQASQHNPSRLQAARSVSNRSPKQPAPNYQTIQQHRKDARPPQDYDPLPKRPQNQIPSPIPQFPKGPSLDSPILSARALAPQPPPSPPASPTQNGNGPPTMPMAPLGGDASSIPATDATGRECPAVWSRISQDLTKMFLQADGQCNDAARATVRAVFHDCGTWSKGQGNTGGCDGSLILSAEENSRTENRGLQAVSASIKELAMQRKVGVADMLAYAGAHATVTCPLGPTVPIKIGRTDSAKTPNEALLPANATLSADVIISLFADKGFSAPEVAALVGAHSTSKQFFADPAKAGQPQDSTPGIWDVKFYSDTMAPPKGVDVFPSDKSLAADPRSGPTFRSFVGQQA
jgi:hypothetical protein